MMSEPQLKRPLSRNNSKTKHDPLKLISHQGESQKFDVIINYIPKEEKELIQNLPVKLQANGDVDLYSVLDAIKQMHFPVEKSMVYYYSPSSDLYVFCGNEPVARDTVIPKTEIQQSEGKSQITLRIRHIAHLQKRSESESVKIGKPNQREEANNPNLHTTRTKERNIGETIDKVLNWRKYYNGYNDPKTGELIKLSLDEAAEKVGIPKKSLDDYLMQIRCAKKYGFNFNDHYNEKMGVLRAFVKKHKTKTPTEKPQSNDMQAVLTRIIEKKTPTKETEKGEESPIREPNTPFGLSLRSKKIHSRR